MPLGVLAGAGVVDYLLEQGLMSVADVVDGGLVIDDVSRRNRNVVVRTRSRPGLFVKQRDPRQSTMTLHREADVYRLLRVAGRAFAHHHAARLRHIDRSRGLLILEHLDGVEPLQSVRRRGQAVDEACARGLGRALGRLHAIPLSTDQAPDAPPIWVFSLCRPNRDVLTDLSAASLSVVRIVQQSPTMVETLRRLSRRRTPKRLIHGDLRLDNCLVAVPAGYAGPERLVLVDWELAGMGDPAWDVATVLCEYLAVWLRSMPLADSLPLDESLAQAACPLSDMRPSLAAFWSAYCTRRGSLDRPWGFLICSVRLMGARLLQTAIETAQTSSHLTKTVVSMLQLAEHTLARPRHVMERLLGLGTPQ